MRLRLYCNRYSHFKDALVCSVNCVYRARCGDFALFYDAHHNDVNEMVGDYFAAQRDKKAVTPTRALPVIHASATGDGFRSLIRLEVKREMAEVAYIWIGADDRAELIELGEVLKRAERGKKPARIYKVAQEMELRFQLVPRKRIEKAKRAAEADAARANARRSRGKLPTSVTSSISDDMPPASAPVAPPARARRSARGRRKPSARARTTVE